MNKKLREIACQILKEDLLNRCIDRQRDIFRRMYSPSDLKANMQTVLDGMGDSQIDWAMTQVQNTIKRNEAERNDRS